MPASHQAHALVAGELIERGEAVVVHGGRTCIDALLAEQSSGDKQVGSLPLQAL